MKVAVLGSGTVGEILANGFVKHGYEVMRGSRDPRKLEEWQKMTAPKGKIGTFQEAAKFGEIVVLAVKGAAAEAVVKSCGSATLKGKTVLDATNPIADAPPQDGVLKFFTDLNGSLMEKLQHAVPDANFVKAFSSIGNAFMVNPNFPDGMPTMFICGNNDKAKSVAREIITQFGWETEDMGTAVAARAIEPLCMLWCIPGFLRNQWSHAFKLLKMET
jgi:predicted dinucleotide-binding enzyme